MIEFVTTNGSKFRDAQELFRAKHLDLVHNRFPLDEIQAGSSGAIAHHKALQASLICFEPFIVEDSSFHIPALGGYPGPYIKYVLQTIGVEGLLRLMHGVAVRDCYFESHLYYCDEQRNFHHYQFSRTDLGISQSIVPTNKGWSDLWDIIQIGPERKHYAELNAAEQRRVNEQWKLSNTFTELLARLEL